MRALRKGTLEGDLLLRAQPGVRRTGVQRAWWFVAAVLAFLGVLAVLTPGLFVAGPAAAGPGELSLQGADRFDDEVLAAIGAYRTPRRAVNLLAFVAGLAVPAAVLGRAARVRRRGSWPGAGAGARAVTAVQLQLRAARTAATIVGLTAAIALPGIAWARVVQDGRYGFRTSSSQRWLADHLLGVGSRALGAAVLAAVLIMLVQRHPRTWPARLTVLATLMMFVGVLLHPVVVHPLLLPERPLPAGPHQEAVAVVVARSGLDVPVVLGEASLRSTRRNAVATGLGPTRRVVLHDTLLTLEPRAVAAITAHELAHLVHRDPLRVVLAPAPLVLMLSLFAQRLLARSRDAAGSGTALGRPAVTALIAAALLVQALSVPLVGFVSRRTEVAADRGGVALSGDPLAHVALLRTLVIEDLVDPAPPWWSRALSTHPAPGERIRVVVSVEPDVDAAPESEHAQ